VADPGNVIIARKLDELCSGNLPGHVASALAGLQSIAAPVEYQGGYPDRRKDRADVDLDIHPIERDAGARAGGDAHEVRPPLTHPLLIGGTGGQGLEADWRSPMLFVSLESRFMLLPCGAPRIVVGANPLGVSAIHDQ